MVASSPESPSLDASGTPDTVLAAGSEPVAKATSTAYASALEVIASVEPRIAEATRAELADQRASLKLIASENYASPAVLLTMGTWFSDKYAEGTVGHRFYAGCQNVDTVESHRRRARQGAVRRGVRLRPAALRHRRQPGRLLVDPGAPGRVAGAGEAPGQERQRAVRGRLGGAAPRARQPADARHVASTPAATSPTASARTSAARCSTSAPTAPTRRPACSTTTGCRAAAKEFKPLILVAGYSAYPRRVNFATMREIADEVGATLMVDMAHFAGLVAGKVFTGDEDPVPHAHVVTTTTHKSLRGPRGGIVLATEEFAPSVDRGCPMVLGGPLSHVMAAKAVALAEAKQQGFRDYAQKVADNAQSLAEGFSSPRRQARHRRHRQPHRAARRDVLRADRAAGRVGAARRRRRHQPQLGPGRPERRLVHLRHPLRHPGADHPRLRPRRVRHGRRAGRRRAVEHLADHHRRPAPGRRRTTPSPTASSSAPTPPRPRCSTSTRSTRASTWPESWSSRSRSDRRRDLVRVRWGRGAGSGQRPAGLRLRAHLAGSVGSRRLRPLAGRCPAPAPWPCRASEQACAVAVEVARASRVRLRRRRRGDVHEGIRPEDQLRTGRGGGVRRRAARGRGGGVDVPGRDGGAVLAAGARSSWRSGPGASPYR